jgi:hypothetical protein
MVLGRCVKRLWVVVGATMVLSSVGLGVAAAGVTQAPEPPLEPPPGVSECRPGDRPETGLQGRVSVEDHASGRAAEGFTCNIDAIGTFGLPAEPAEPADAPAPPVTEAPVPVEATPAPEQPPEQLPATGGSIPAVFLLTAALGAAVLLAGLRGAPARP